MRQVRSQATMVAFEDLRFGHRDQRLTCSLVYHITSLDE